jgi:hypothetical protein
MDQSYFEYGPLLGKHGYLSMKSAPLSDKPVLNASVLQNQNTTGRNYLVTQVTDMEQEFLCSPWQGARFLFPENSTLTVLSLSNKVRSLKNIQETALAYREFKNTLGSTRSSCVMNINAIPKMPGYMGYIFGYQGIISIIEEDGKVELRQIHYDDSDGPPTLCNHTESAMQGTWEDKICGPFEEYILKLFHN